jgi:hypothetical protein
MRRGIIAATISDIDRVASAGMIGFIVVPTTVTTAGVTTGQPA